MKQMSFISSSRCSRGSRPSTLSSPSTEAHQLTAFGPQVDSLQHLQATEALGHARQVQGPRFPAGRLRLPGAHAKRGHGNCRAAPPERRRQQRQQPARQQQDHQDERHAQQQLPQERQVPAQVRARHIDEDGAQYRAPDGAASAQRHPDDQLRAEHESCQLRRHHAAERAIAEPRQAGHGAAHYQQHDPPVGGVQAQVAATRFIVAQRHQDAPAVASQTWKLTAMMDQHAFMQIGEGDDIQVGDMIAFDISHPCLTFDKWRQVLLVDEQYRVTDVAETFF
ncbi:hypothetical protein G6F31_014618 [Rhizopus arrhizus]|nr:hypothetical protein G6F31_014618 [Rhizopus arrhizus]